MNVTKFDYIYVCLKVSHTMNTNYEMLTREQLIQLCLEKDATINTLKPKRKRPITATSTVIATVSEPQEKVEEKPKRKRPVIATTSSEKNEVIKKPIVKGKAKEKEKEKENDFSDLSVKITKLLTISDKKNNGIYFTPLSIIKQTIQKIEALHTFKTVLEPSCGSCEFIKQLDKGYDGLEITGIELNKTIYNNICDQTFENDVTLLNEDFLKFKIYKKYDLIIGNPPYFVMSKSDVVKEYLKYFDGRPNIFVLFIVKALELLAVDGVLAFVLPNNFLNSMYYNKLRLHIQKEYRLLDIVNHSAESYLETQQDTCVIILQNKKPSTSDNHAFTYPCADGTLLFNTTEAIENLKKLYHGATSLDSLGFEVKVGNIVWNQHKDILTDDEDSTLLIYSSDITDNELSIKSYNNDEKKNYIDKEGSTDLLLVVNRGYGKGKYTFSYLLVDLDRPYLIENHLICIRSKKAVGYKELKAKYQKIIASFKDERTGQFVELFFGNNAISTSELQHILPIY